MSRVDEVVGEVAAWMVDRLESDPGSLSWSAPWHNVGSVGDVLSPVNATTGNRYRGFNSFAFGGLVPLVGSGWSARCDRQVKAMAEARVMLAGLSDILSALALVVTVR